MNALDSSLAKIDSIVKANKPAWDFQPSDTAAFLENEPAPIERLFTDRIQLGRGILTTGVGGSSKSRLLYHLAIGAAIGRLPWGWEVKHRGSSVLLLTEDTEGDVHRTLWGTCRAMNLTATERSAVSRHVLCYPLAGHDCKLVGVDPGNGALVQNGLFKGLEDVIRKRGDVVFVGLDPALSLTPGDELNQGHQRALGKMADDMAVRTDAAVMLISHASKGSLSKDELGSHNARGGGAITDAVRGEFSMRTMTAKEAKDAGILDKEERNRHVQLAATKGNHLPPAAFVEIWLRRGDHGTLSAATLQFSEKGAVTTASSHDLKVLEVLKAMCATHTPRLGEWRDACIESGLIPAGIADTQKKTMDRIVKRLMADNYITKGIGAGIYLPTDDEE